MFGELDHHVPYFPYSFPRFSQVFPMVSPGFPIVSIPSLVPGGDDRHPRLAPGALRGDEGGAGGVRDGVLDVG